MLCSEKLGECLLKVMKTAELNSLLVYNTYSKLTLAMFVNGRYFENKVTLCATV